MQCKLCGLEKTLLKKSHIIPEFLFKGIYGTDNYVLDINLTNLARRRKIQTGYFEKDILCATCDNEVLGRLERYANNHFYNPPKNSVVMREFVNVKDDELPFIRHTNIYTSILKLFFLSILWRSSLCTHDFFSQIQLGNRYTEQIRAMLFSGNPGKWDDFGVVAVILPEESKRPTKSIIQPMKYKSEGNTCYVFHIDRVMYHFNISKFNRLSSFDIEVMTDTSIDLPILSGSFADGYFDSYLGLKRTV